MMMIIAEAKCCLGLFFTNLIILFLKKTEFFLQG